MLAQTKGSKEIHIAQPGLVRSMGDISKFKRITLDARLFELGQQLTTPLNIAAEPKVLEVYSTNWWIDGKMCTKTAKMDVFTEKMEKIQTPNTVLPKDIKMLNASKVIFC